VPCAIAAALHSAVVKVSTQQHHRIRINGLPKHLPYAPVSVIQSFIIKFGTTQLFRVQGKKKCRTIHFLCQNWRTTFNEKLQIFSRQE
jgi:hypothetical protein